MDDFVLKAIKYELQEDGLLAIFPIKKETSNFKAIVVFEYNNFIYADMIESYEETIDVQEIIKITKQSLRNNKRDQKEINIGLKNPNAIIKIKLSGFIQGQIKMFHWLSRKQYDEVGFHKKYGTLKIIDLINEEKTTEQIMEYFFKEYEIGYDTQLFEKAP